MNKEISKVDINKAIKDIRFRADQLDRIMMCAFRDADDVDKMFKQADEIETQAFDVAMCACFLKAAFNERKKQGGVENE